MAGTIALAGWWTDRCQDRRIPFLAGLAALAASTIMFFVGPNLATLTVVRAFQGLSATIVWISGLALLTARSKPGGIGKLIGYVTTGTALGELAGPLLGGVVYQFAGYWALCAVAMTVVGLDIVLRVLLSEQKDQDKTSAPDEHRPLLTHDQPHQKYYGPKDQDDTRRAPADDGRPGEQELQKALPPVSSFTKLLKDPNFLSSLFAVLVGSIIRNGLESAIPLYTSQRFHFSTSITGLVILTFISPNLAGAYIGEIAERHGPRMISIGSCAGFTASFVVLGLIPGQSAGSIVGFCITVFFAGVSESFLLLSNMVAISVAAIRVSKNMDTNSEGGKMSAEGRAFACMNLAYGSGMLLGPLWVVGVLKLSDWKALCISFAGLTALSGGLLGFTWRRWNEMKD